MTASNFAKMIDRFAATAVTAVMLAALPVAAASFVATSL